MSIELLMNILFYANVLLAIIIYFIIYKRMVKEVRNNE